MKHIARLIVCAAALLGVKPLIAQSNEDPIRMRVDVDRSVLPANCPGRAVVNIRLDCPRPPEAARRPPVNLALVIDRSGSMRGEKIAKAREAALEVVRRLAPDDIVSLIAFDTEVETLVPAQRVGAARGRLESAICNIEPGGYTALYGGVVRGAEEVRRFIEEPNYVNRIILVSDGIANVGPSSPEDLGRLGASLVNEGISVTTVGLGLDFNEDLMARLAQRSDGNTYFARFSSDLPRIFSAELGDLLSVVARRVVITIEFPDGVRPIRFIGREGVIRGQRAELRLNQLYGGQEKFALIEVEVAPAREGEEREIARARMNCEDALDRRPLSLSASRRVQFSNSQEAVVQSADKKVQADFAANVLALAKEEAVALVDAGRKDEAAAVIRQKAAELKSLGATYGNAAVAGCAAAAAPEADRIERDGLDNVTRKAYRAESSQVRNQQATDSDPHGP